MFAPVNVKVPVPVFVRLPVPPITLSNWVLPLFDPVVSVMPFRFSVALVTLSSSEPKLIGPFLQVHRHLLVDVHGLRAVVARVDDHGARRALTAFSASANVKPAAVPEKALMPYTAGWGLAATGSASAIVMPSRVAGPGVVDVHRAGRAGIDQHHVVAVAAVVEDLQASCRRP